MSVACGHVMPCHDAWRDVCAHVCTQCMHVCMHVCNAWTLIRTEMHIYIYIYGCMRACVSVCMRACMDAMRVLYSYLLYAVSVINACHRCLHKIECAHARFPIYCRRASTHARYSCISATMRHRMYVCMYASIAALCGTEMW